MKIKIGIVEDEKVIGNTLRYLLENMGYEVPTPRICYEDAISMLVEEMPDIALLDIKLRSERDGIAVAQYIRDHLDMPFIFLTGSSDAATLSRAKAVRPAAFLVKPFKKEDLYTSVEIALHNFNDNKNAGSKEPEKKYIFLKDGSQFYKVYTDEILYLASNHVYIKVHTHDKSYLLRASLQQYLKELDPAAFVRVHRSYIINIDKIDVIGMDHVVINNEKIPISKNYRNELTHLRS